MKFLLITFICLFIITKVCQADQFDNEIEFSDKLRNPLNTKFQEFLVKLKGYMKNGNTTLRIPRVDPFIAKQINLSFEEYPFEMSGELKNLEVKNLSEYDIGATDLKLTGPKMKFALIWKEISGRLDYNVNGKVMDANLYGKGNISFVIKQFGVAVNLLMKKVDSNTFPVKKLLRVDALRTNVSMKSLKFHLTGLYNDEEFSKLWSKVISDTTPIALKRYYVKKISPHINRRLIDLIDGYLKNFTLKDILAMFMGNF